MKKRFTLTGVTLILIIIAGYYFVLSEAAEDLTASGSTVSSIAMPPTPAGAPVVWASSASMISELVMEADLIVRAIVVREPEPRVVSFPVPIWAEDGTIIEEGFDKITFSDTQMEVMEVYKGLLENNFILVMQTGAKETGAQGDGLDFSLRGDPLYTEGEESILFLVDISDDPIHSQGRYLYRIINPAGRYTIQGAEAVSHSERLSSSEASKTVDELVRQIKEHVSKEEDIEQGHGYDVYHE